MELNCYVERFVGQLSKYLFRPNYIIVHHQAEQQVLLPQRFLQTIK